MSNLLEEIEEGFELGVDDLEIASKRLVELFKHHRHCRRHHRRSPHVIFTIRYETLIIQGDMIQMELELGQEFIATATPDGTIQPGSVLWASDNTSIATVAPNPANELEAQVTSVSAGSTTIRATADADSGSGVTEVSGSIDVTVTGTSGTGAATRLDITAGPATPIPATL